MKKRPNGSDGVRRWCYLKEGTDGAIEVRRQRYQVSERKGLAGAAGVGRWCIRV